MKKTVISVLLAAACATGAFAKSSGTQYKVYDVKMSLKTTKAGGQTSTACGDTYAYRVAGKRKIEGVIAGCGCLAMAGDPTCEAFDMYFWDATTKTQLTNYTFKTEVLQRIGKDGKTAEHVATFVVGSPDGERFELVLAGLGKYNASKKDVVYDTVSVNGGVAGMADAPYRVTRGTCGACGEIPGSVDQTQAIAVCEEGTCVVSTNGCVTPAYGSYSLKYNKSKSAKCEKTGVTAKTLGIPSYVVVAQPD